MEASETVFADAPETEDTPTPKDTNFSQTGEVLPEQEFYCPACGARYSYRRPCSGTPEQPHQPTEIVSTEELQGDTHTAAPSSE